MHSHGGLRNLSPRCAIGLQCTLGLCRHNWSHMCRDSICAFKGNASNISRSGFEKNSRQYYDITMIIYIQDLQTLQITWIHFCAMANGTSWGRWGRTQRPLQGLTQPETQGTISRNDEKQRFLTQSCWTQFFVFWFKAKSWSKTS